MDTAATTTKMGETNRGTPGGVHSGNASAGSRSTVGVVGWSDPSPTGSQTGPRCRASKVGKVRSSSANPDRLSNCFKPAAGRLDRDNPFSPSPGPPNRRCQVTGAHPRACSRSATRCQSSWAIGRPIAPSGADHPIRPVETGGWSPSRHRPGHGGFRCPGLSGELRRTLPGGGGK